MRKEKRDLRDIQPVCHFSYEFVQGMLLYSLDKLKKFQGRGRIPSDLSRSVTLCFELDLQKGSSLITNNQIFL